MMSKWTARFLFVSALAFFIVPDVVAQTRGRGRTSSRGVAAGGRVGTVGSVRTRTSRFGVVGSARTRASRFGQFGPYVTRRGGFVGGRTFNQFSARSRFLSRASFRPYGAPGSTVVFNRLGRFYGTGLYNYPRSFVGGYPVFSYRRPNYGYFGVPAIGLGYHPFVPYSGIRSSQVTVSQTYAPTYNLYQGGVSQAPQNNPDNGSPTVPLSQADVKVFALDGRTSTGIQPNRPTPVVTITTQGSTTPAPANVMVRVPSQNAQLYFNGVKTKQSGLLREFRTPQLPSQKGYQYKVKVVWQQDGTQREKEHVVRLEAGQEVLVNLSDPRVLANESPSETPSTQKSVQFVTNK